MSAALRGLSVAIVEKDTWGGCCLNRGCVPKKTLYATAKRIQEVSIYRELGITGTLNARLSSTWSVQKRVVDKVRESYISYLTNLGVSKFTGTARLVNKHEISISFSNAVETISGKCILLATGSSAHFPAAIKPIPKRILTTDDLFREKPPEGKRVAIVGGGVIAAEFAFILSHLGCKVFWLTRKKPLLKSMFSPQALKIFSAHIENDNLEICLGNQVLSSKVGTKYLSLKLDTGNTLRVDWALLATGRKPNTADLGLEEVGIETDNKGFIQRNESLQTAVDNIYAIGDCACDMMTANHAIAEANFFVNRILDKSRQKYDPLSVPQVIYSAIEMARMGLNEDMAEDQGFEPAVGFAAFENSPAALAQGHTEGYVRLLADMDSGQFLGSEVIGDDAGELINYLSKTDIPKDFLAEFAKTHFNHPSRSEEFMNALETLAVKWGLVDSIF